ncbi:MAG: hypothetical protein LBL96_03660 [Clostridiales bacterium]|jgi:hypothetical protein|nr:hypothetical protein [Clostridiales bacterium]
MTNEELQSLAEELAGLDREKDAARIRAIETQIIEYEHSLLRNSNGKAYFPLLKKHNGVIPFEDFYDFFPEVLLRLVREYNPQKGTFATALAFMLNKRAIDYWAKLGKQPPTIDIYRADENDTRFEIPDTRDFTTDIAEDLSTEMRVFARLAPLVEEQKKADCHLTKKMWFERFFTFDVTKTVKGDRDCAVEAIEVNDDIFPIMEAILLEYMMFGSFAHIRDVIVNKLKDTKSLSRRNEVIRECYGISKPTVCSRNAAYFEVFKKAIYS